MDYRMVAEYSPLQRQPLVCLRRQLIRFIAVGKYRQTLHRQRLQVLLPRHLHLDDFIETFPAVGFHIGGLRASWHIKRGVVVGRESLVGNVYGVHNVHRQRIHEASLKGIAANTLHRRGDIYRLQCATTLKSIPADSCHSIGNDQVCHFLPIYKQVVGTIQRIGHIVIEKDGTPISKTLDMHL